MTANNAGKRSNPRKSFLFGILLLFLGCSHSQKFFQNRYILNFYCCPLLQSFFTDFFHKIELLGLKFEMRVPIQNHLIKFIVSNYIVIIKLRQQLDLVLSEDQFALFISFTHFLQLLLNINDQLLFVLSLYKCLQNG